MYIKLFLKSRVKIFTPLTWKTAITAFTCCLQRRVLFSASMICNTASCHRRFSQLFMLFQSCKLCVYIPSLLSQNPRHTTKPAQIMASFIHRLLTFVNDAKKDIVVGCFRVTAAGANTARGRNWFSRSHPVG